ncbi:MAG: maltose alpha-D-glucosyltransferase [Gemmatimonadaceae bacterium]|nr:maltose alpha-D-glucosyltransferase [Acetobacteraceae bacterium]
MARSSISITAPSTTEDPFWYKDAIIYQLHLKSFYDGNNDGVGDFRGLIEKLDYVAELGVTAIWMLPFYPSPRRDDGYDIADYQGVHADYGTIDDVRHFIDAAHSRGLRVITELVINHTSDQHPWFQAARLAPAGSPERERYVWSDSNEKYAGTRIIFLDTETSNWTFDPVAGAYYWHRFYSHQPDLNFDNPAVLNDVLDIMAYWLDLGIDGLRLDAVPYLIEREGTNNENLPETHDILKKIRAAMDLHFPGRMLLAEANQWPEDAQQYFGDGDECHMSFHFPLMPRMYMAIAREDRFPITDIMRQTPEIPNNCQWAVFLRNHDELTLEMVTSGERDYLWNTYAADRRARINLGIRRRLSPLLERDRRRIELMNGLLLSMPGTPVIYYGDEIGMGDNIFLGDRDGVRTPMQWSMDRNGGFSRADPAQLVLPPIMDANYGFQAVNVEAQAADPHSMLNWTRRMLAVRRRHQSFGRGAQRFLYPGNRKILAYLREHTGPDGATETILCVSNLSRTAQAVELDLSAYAGRVPVDIVGGSVFPPVGQLTYLLTLPPYGFFWFLLAAEAQLPSWHAAPPEPLPEYATLVMRAGLADVLNPQGRAVLEREALPAYLPKRRWFASKTERLDGVRLAYAAALPGTGGSIMFAEIEASLSGRTENYVLPLGVAWEDETAGALVQQLALTRVRRGPRVGYLTDAFAVDAMARGIITALRDGAVVSLDDGELRFIPSGPMATLDLAEDAEIRRLSAEQSNSSLIVGDALVLKLVRRVLAGVHPEAEMTGYLTERGFGNTAPLFGEVVRVAGDGTPHTVALAQGFVRNQGDGWTYTLDFLARGVEEAALTGADADTHETEIFVAYEVFVRAIGTRLGELHAALSQPTDRADFRPETVDTAVLSEWADGAIEQIESALATLRAVKDWPDAAADQQATALLTHGASLIDAARRLAQQGHGALNTRVHGDFHLGQVLVVQGDAYIIDFEGEPARTMEQRRAKSCPLRDVAGILRSFDYAAAAAAPGRVAASEQATERRQTILQQFRVRASASFLDAYQAVLAVAEPRWVPAEAEGPLLDLFLLEKAAYEIRYEAANRPTWIGIPLGGFYAIAARLLSLETTP